MAELPRFLTLPIMGATQDYNALRDLLDRPSRLKPACRLKSAPQKPADGGGRYHIPLPYGRGSECASSLQKNGIFKTGRWRRVQVAFFVLDVLRTRLAVLIREEQYSTLEDQSKKAFRTRIASFVREHHTQYIDDLTEEEVDSFIDDAIASGTEFGCETDRDYMLFSTPCAIYGARSMQDPIFQRIYFASLEWSAAGVKRSIDGMIDALSQVLDAEFAAISGAQVLRGLGEGLFPGGSPRARRLKGSSQLVPFFERFFPARQRRLREGELTAHLQKSQDAAQRIGLQTPEGILVYQQVAYFIGCEFGWDGLYPWAIKALHKDVPEEARLKRLEAAVKVITDRAAKAA